MTVVGPLADTTGTLVKEACAKFGVPPFVKEAATEEIYNRSMPKYLYADTTNKDFPIHTPAACFISASLALHQRDYSSKTAANIKFAMSKLGLHGMWDAMEKLARTYEPKPTPIKCYALGDKYPIDTKEQVTTATLYFSKYASHFSKEDRKTYASNLLKADDIHKTMAKHERHFVEMKAGLGRPIVKAARLAEPYAKYVEGIKMEGCEKLASSIRDAAALVDEGKADAEDFADVIDSIRSKIAGLPKTDELRNQLTEGTPTYLREMSDRYIEAPSGNIYDKFEFDKVSAEVFCKVLGSTPILSREKKAELLKTNGHVVENLLSAHGVTPIASPPVERKTITTNWDKWLTT